MATRLAFYVACDSHMFRLHPIGLMNVRNALTTLGID